jgi:disulfide bond formation protein DsbB
MTTDSTTLFFALLALLCNVSCVVGLLAWALRHRLPQLWNTVRTTVAPSALTLAALVAAVATAGSLYLSEVAHFVPCRLCWYQRIGMYPLVVILVIAAIRRDTRAWVYPFALASAGLCISIYHVLLERFPSLETGACDPNNPCTIVWVRHFGFVTIPYMAASAFLAIALLAVLATRQPEEISDVEESTRGGATSSQPTQSRVRNTGRTDHDRSRGHGRARAG